MRLLARGYIVANVNFSLENSRAVDIFCSNGSLKNIIAVQVKSIFDESKTFRIGLSHEDFCVNGVFDEAKAMKSLEEKIVCPWIFVHVDTSAEIPAFRIFILKREMVIRLALESEKWYLNEVFHKGPLNPKSSVAIVLAWLEGYDTPAKAGKSWRNHFSNPYPNTKFRFEDAWENLGLD